MQLLKTKFHIPDFNENITISRNRLGRIINDNAPISIISAPAGFGKTTFLSEWVCSCKHHVAWVSLEKSENNPSVFWSYLISAIHPILNGCENSSLEKIKTMRVLSIENILIDVINRITDQTSKITLILDDFHVISDKTIHSGMEFLMDHLPENMSIIISGREDPGFSISKFRAAGKLTEIRESTFRFNTEETNQLINDIHGLSLNNEEVDSLRIKTDGWIAGLYLAILSMKEQTDKKDFIDNFTGSHRFITDYLVDEVLSVLEGETRNFILQISILERFSPHLCEKVTGNIRSSLIINEMEKNNLFLIPLDNNREWFRFHHLFREFLLKHLNCESGDYIRQLHFKAYAWLKDNGFGTEAFNHVLLSGSYGEAAEFLSCKAPDLFYEFGGMSLKNCIDSLPFKYVGNNPDLCCYHVMINVLSGNFQSLDLLYKDEFKQNSTVNGFISLIKSYSYFFRTGEFEKSIEEVKLCLRILPEKHLSAREMGELILTLSLRYNGDISSAHKFIGDLSLQDNIPVLKAISYADIILAMGKLDLAMRFIEKQIEEGKKRFGKNLVPEYGYLLILKSGILRERNNIDEALRICRKGLLLSGDCDYVEFDFLGNLEYSRILAAANSFRDADKAMADSIEATRKISSWSENMSTAFKIRLEIIKGNTHYARQLLNEIVDFNKARFPYHKHHEILSLCRYFIIKKEAEKVHKITDSMIMEDIPVGRNGRLIECYVLKAIAYFIQKDTENALETLNKSFKLSAKEGYVRIYLEEGQNMQALFREALKRNILPEYLKKHVFESTLRAQNIAEKKSVIINDFKENFNHREIEILELLKQGCSNKTIAEELFLSVNTVRWYASRIFAKLNVKRRGEAVAYAQKYNLI